MLMYNSVSYYDLLYTASRFAISCFLSKPSGVKMRFRVSFLRAFRGAPRFDPRFALLHVCASLRHRLPVL